MAGAVPHEMTRELERLLVVAAEEGRTLALSEMQGELGVGHDDLGEMLDALREKGTAVEAAPSEWRGPMVDEMPPSEPAPDQERRVRVSVGENDREQLAPRATALSVGMDATVKLTPAVAAALSAEALGEVVKAGIAEANKAGDAFVLEVGP